MKKDFLQELVDVLPPIVFRNHPRFRELIGMSPRSIANMDCLGQGPNERILVGRVCGYPRAAFIEWLRDRSKIIS
jgi:hypothetical protein